MKNNFTFLFSILTILTIFVSCSQDEEGVYVPIANIVKAPVSSPVNYNLEAFPYATLSEYNLFLGDLKSQNPVIGVVPYKPISSLFTDFAKKKRFIWLPENTSATFVSDYEVLDFPIGTIIVKTFYYNNVLPLNNTKIVETRLLIKKPTGWIFSEYVWNDEQTEATLDNSGSTVNIEWIEAGVPKTTNYRIPSESECLTCHKKANIPTPIGPKPQNLNSNYEFPLTGNINQLQNFINIGYLNAVDYSNVNTVVDWKDLSNPLHMRARSYLDINCAHCHSDNTHCSYRPIRFSFHETETLDDNLGICVVPEENIDSNLRHIVSPGRSERSVLSFRMNATEESIRMPLLGRTLVDDAAVQLMEEWINSLTQICR